MEVILQLAKPEIYTYIVVDPIINIVIMSIQIYKCEGDGARANARKYTAKTQASGRGNCQNDTNNLLVSDELLEWIIN